VPPASPLEPPLDWVHTTYIGLHRVQEKSDLPLFFPEHGVGLYT